MQKGIASSLLLLHGVGFSPGVLAPALKGVVSDYFCNLRIYLIATL